MRHDTRTQACVWELNMDHAHVVCFCLLIVLLMKEEEEEELSRPMFGSVQHT